MLLIIRYNESTSQQKLREKYERKKEGQSAVREKVATGKYYILKIVYRKHLRHVALYKQKNLTIIKKKQQTQKVMSILPTLLKARYKFSFAKVFPSLLSCVMRWSWWGEGTHYHRMQVFDTKMDLHKQTTLLLLSN